MRRWLSFSLALAATLLALVVLLRGFGFLGGGHPPLDEIDGASRKRLEQVLRDAERIPLAEPGARAVR